MTILASVIAAIATSAKWSERAAQHHAAAAAYGDLHRRFEEALAIPPATDEGMRMLVEQLRAALTAVPMNAPPIPDSIWKAIPHELTPDASDSLDLSPPAATTLRVSQ